MADRKSTMEAGSARLPFEDRDDAQATGRTDRDHAWRESSKSGKSAAAGYAWAVLAIIVIAQIVAALA